MKKGLLENDPKGVDVLEQPKSKSSLRYSDEDLLEFKNLIVKKLDNARKLYEEYKNAITHADGNGVQDTSPSFKILEEGAATLSKEEAGRLAQRQQEFIQHLEPALVRIENKTYGVCRITGCLISKQRLRAVPHATTSVEGKEIDKRMPKNRW